MVLVKNLKSKKGITMIEMMLYAVVIALIVAAAFAGYNRWKNSDYVTRKPKEMQLLLSALEAARVSNGGAYPASTTAIDLTLPSTSTLTGAAQLLAASLGTDNNEYREWTYTCTGGTLTIRVNVGDTPNRNLRVAVNRAIHNNLNNQGWDCNPDSYDGSTGTFNCTKSAACR